MRMIIEYTQLECGTMENILEQDYNKSSNCIINHKWITEIRQHLHNCKATVAVQPKMEAAFGTHQRHSNRGLSDPPTNSLEGSYRTQTGVAYTCVLSLSQI
jgi:hypothetical protein